MCTILMTGCGAGTGESSSTESELSVDSPSVVSSSNSGSTTNTGSGTSSTDSSSSGTTGSTTGTGTSTGSGSTNTTTTTPVAVDRNVLPFNKVPRSTLTASSKKVFAHYFTPFPLSINNKKPAEEYYRTNYLNPFGENGKFLDVGGFLRQKPLDRAPIPSFEAYQNSDLRHEIRLAASMGIDGFAVDILDYKGTQWNRVMNLLDIAQQEYSDFSILLMPDMVALDDPNDFVPMIQALAAKTAAYRAEDGRLIIAPYLASRQTPQWWGAQIQKLKSLNIKVALMPVYQGWRNGLQDFIAAYPNDYQNMLYGVSDWGTRNPTGAATLEYTPDEVHSYGIKWMSPVAPQDMRPKSSKFTEAGNSETLRKTWLSAINGNADWVQIITWNDYSEATEVSPSSGTHYAFYDLVTYFCTWFKNGRPPIVRDTLYAFYREHTTSASFVSGAVQTIPMEVTNGEAARDQIELVGFLKEPGTLQIEIAGKVYTMEANAGVTSFKVPLQNGKPVFKLIRNGTVAQQMTGSWNITSTVSIQNMLYHGMSSRRLDPATNTTAVSWPWRFGTYSSSQKLTDLDGVASPFARSTNLNALRYSDTQANPDTGVGFSFTSAANTKRTKIVFDFKMESAGQTTAEASAVMADTSSREGAWFNIKANASATLGVAVDSYSSTTTVTVPYNVWHRAEITVSELVSTGDNYKLVVTDANGKTVSSTTYAFQSNIEDIGQLILTSSGSSKVKLVIDNVSAVNL